MGFRTQPNAWQCGPLALKHALLALGIVAEERVLTRASGAGAEGTDERDLARAAARYRCDLGFERLRDPADAARALAAHLSAATPVLLCVDQWSHWVTAAGIEDDTIVLLDSREDGVFGTVRRSALAARLAYRHGPGRPRYDLHPLVPRRPSPRARFSLPRVALLRTAAERDLARTWGGYLAMLLPISRLPGPQAEWTIGIGDALRTHAARAARWSRRRLVHAAFVADTHGLEAAADAGRELDTVARRIAGRAAA
jgi:hypothetical protein